ncbi:hypothetical protein K469DRAFT_576461, partial [Zopfia rhizophila CBS 207.26]
YLKEFSTKCERCIQAGIIKKERKEFYLMKGLPKHYAQKVLEYFNLRLNEPLHFKYQEIMKYLQRRVQVKSEA